MEKIDPNDLKPFARKYIWWKTPEEAVAMPTRVIAQVMNIGDYADVMALTHRVGDDVLREVLIHAEAGQFTARSWTFWHYRSGLADVDSIMPPMRTRKFA